jgi:hypothetical protein
MFDSNGYPTEKLLNRISKLCPSNKQDPWEIVDFIISVWHWGDMMVTIDREKNCFQISTGGWSGNESIIFALEKSIFWACYWYKSQRGGHYWFEVKEIYGKNEDGV